MNSTPPTFTRSSVPTRSSEPAMPSPSPVHAAGVLELVRPQSVSEALAMIAPASSVLAVPTHADTEGGRLWLAGGQSLLAAMKLGMVAPSMLIDLQDLPGLREIRVESDASAPQGLWIGAMATHASVGRSAVVRQFAPGLAALASGIADAQVREMGTLGGSLAHNDPSACWPAGVLASDAVVVTDRRDIAADDYFQGLYSTALAPGELITGVRFPRLQAFHYLKFEQPASRFALVGVAVAVLAPTGSGPAGHQPRMRVAVTGLGQGVLRWQAAEHALGAGLQQQALQALGDDALEALQAMGDLHATAAYRQHLVRVLTQRCVAALGGGAVPQPAPLRKRQMEAPRANVSHPNLNAPLSSAATTAMSDGASVRRPLNAAASKGPSDPAVPASREGFGGAQRLAAPRQQVWATLLDPLHLQACIPGCESLLQTRDDAYEATVKVGLGPLSVRFKTEVLLRDQHPPQALTLVFKGNAGALGSGQGTAQVTLLALPDGSTQLDWWVQVQLGGRLAQFGNRLVEATSRKLSAEFFDRISIALRVDPSVAVPTSTPAAIGPVARLVVWWRRVWQFFFSFFGK